jgi:hypothetical protein
VSINTFIGAIKNQNYLKRSLNETIVHIVTRLVQGRGGEGDNQADINFNTLLQYNYATLRH